MAPSCRLGQQLANAGHETVALSSQSLHAQVLTETDAWRKFRKNWPPSFAAVSTRSAAVAFLSMKRVMIKLTIFQSMNNFCLKSWPQCIKPSRYGANASLSCVFLVYRGARKQSSELALARARRVLWRNNRFYYNRRDRASANKGAKRGFRVQRPREHSGTILLFMPSLLCHNPLRRISFRSGHEPESNGFRSFVRCDVTTRTFFVLEYLCICSLCRRFVAARCATASGKGERKDLSCLFFHPTKFGEVTCQPSFASSIFVTCL